MAVRTFEEGAEIELGIGACNRTGALTDVALCRPTGWGDTWPTLMANIDDNKFPRTATMLLPEGDGPGINLYAGNADRDASAPIELGEWQLIAVTKAAGDATGRAHHYSFKTQKWTHANLSGSQETDVGDQKAIRIGSFFGDNYFVGDIAALMQLGVAMSDEEVEALVEASSLAEWMATNPLGLWLFDQQSTEDSVSDLTGQGADQTAISGTSVTEDDPPIPYGDRPEPPSADWEMVFDSGLGDNAFGVAVLGVLGNDLYLFGSSGESVGAMAGVHRWNGSGWDRLYEGDGEDFNQIATYGAVPYKGKLYVGDRRRGRLRRLDLDSNGDFVALTDVGGEGFVGTEDVFPGPVWKGYLWLGTYGNKFNPDLGLEPPGVYRFDGSKVEQVLRLDDIGVGGEVRSLIVYQGQLWVAASNEAMDLCELWVIDADGDATLIESSEQPMVMARRGEDLISATLQEGEGAQSQLRRWNGSGWEALTIPFSVHRGSDWLVAIGNQVWMGDFFQGIRVWDGLAITNIGLGVDVKDPGESSETSENYGGPVSIKRVGGYVWVATDAPLKVWRTPDPGPAAQGSLYIYLNGERVPVSLEK